MAEAIRTPPRMVVVAGPPGSGKSTAFPVSSIEEEYFNADDRAAELNGGSYFNIQPSVRQRVNRELEIFINRHTWGRRGFAFETTLRTNVLWDQLRTARALNFFTAMIFVGVDRPETCVTRIIARAQSGGHSAPEEFILNTYHNAISNLGRAFLWFDKVHVFDNSIFDEPPHLILETEKRAIVFLAANPPSWLLPAFVTAYIEFPRALKF